MEIVLKHPTAFGDDSTARRRQSAAIAHLLEAYSRIARDQYATIGDLPSIYDGGVRYRADSADGQRWLDAATLTDEGIGDCKSLASARCGELRARYNINAVPLITWRRGDDGRALFHVQVGRMGDNSTLSLPPGAAAREGILWRTRNGTLVEDPSAVLGMYGFYYGR